MIPERLYLSLLLGALLASAGAQESRGRKLARCRRELAVLEGIAAGRLRLPALEIERTEFADKVYNHAGMRRDLGSLVSQVRLAKAELVRAETRSNIFWYGEYHFPFGAVPSILHAVIYRAGGILTAPMTGSAWKEWRNIQAEWERAKENLDHVKTLLGPRIAHLMKVTKGFALHPFPPGERGTTTLEGRTIRKADMNIHQCRRRLREIVAEIRRIERWREREDVKAIRWPGGGSYRPKTLEEAIAVKREEIEELLRGRGLEGLAGRYTGGKVPEALANAWNSLLSRITKEGGLRVVKNSLRVSPMNLEVFLREGKGRARISPWSISIDLVVRERNPRGGGWAKLRFLLSFKEAALDEKGEGRIQVTGRAFLSGSAGGGKLERNLLDRNMPDWRIVPGEPRGRVYLVYGPPPGKPLLFRLVRSP